MNPYDGYENYDESNDYDYNLFDLLDNSEDELKKKEYDYNIFDLLDDVDLSMQDMSNNLLNEKESEKK